ncbi:hypothetical protein GCM10017691_41600 [Pseudonocardia petroleophila]|uniref:Uncharacterized protein n=1 Tax=Pseudonocardia petroleophila TaxID=37331 RepID=A0A7G7MBI9_9PSEU|nr:hypothetical protein [Pseudonocardia petroleophila]QNG50150.1 hypothetical protein H6H00_17955 [Pseudonocardia petroleophila]
MRVPVHDPAQPGGPELGRRELARVLLLAVAAVAATACDDGPGGGVAGLDALAAEVVADTPDLAALLARLRPDPADVAEVFAADTVVAAVRHYDGYWLHPRVVPPTRTQTAHRVTSVGVEELAAGTGAAATFPSGYRDVAPHLRPGLVLHRITFTEPGAASGIDVDALVLVRGRWRLFPTPWFVLLVDDPGHRH